MAQPPGIPVTLVRIRTRDGVWLDGVVTEPRRRRGAALVWVHGLGSVFSSGQPLMRELSARLNAAGLGYLKFNTRGHDVVVRAGMGLAGAAELQKFVDEGGVLLTFGVASYFPAEFGLARGVDAQSPAQGFYAPGPYVQSEILQPTHPVMFGYTQKTLPVRYAGGPLLQAGPPPGFEQFAGSSPERPQVIARFQGGEAGVLSGLMRNPDQTRNRAMVVDAPSGKGRVILYANNPIYRWQTFGEHAMVFNALMFWNDMPDGSAAASKTTNAQ